MKNLKWKLKEIKFIFLSKLVRKYGRVIDNVLIPEDDKEKFEKDLVKLIKKYKVVDSTTRIQHLEIIADATDLPKIKVETLII